MVTIPEGSESYSGESDCTTYGSSQETLDQPGEMELDPPGVLTGSGGCHIAEEAMVAKRAAASGGGGDGKLPPTSAQDVLGGSIEGACELSGL